MRTRYFTASYFIQIISGDAHDSNSYRRIWQGADLSILH
jgi:hypothetical protein